MATERTEKHEQTRNSLPDELKPVFDDFVSYYKFAATKHHGSPFVSYVVLAEMVRLGWRLAAEPTKGDVSHREHSDPEPRLSGTIQLQHVT